MNITIIGAGSIGLLITCYLYEQGHRVQLITRTREQAKQINQTSIICEKKNESVCVKVKATEFRNFLWLDDDIVIVSLKQGNIPLFLTWAKEVIPFEIPILFLQNGMGHIERAKETLENPIFAGIVTHGAFRKSERSIKHTGIGELVIGGNDNQIHLLNELWSTDLTFPITKADNIVDNMKIKLLVNAVINPLTAIYQVKNGVLLENLFLKHEAYKVFKEVSDILNLKEEQWDHVMKIITLTSNNQSSMLSDILAERRTEADAITGYLLMLAYQNGKEANKILELHEKIKRIEEAGNA